MAKAKSMAHSEEFKAPAGRGDLCRVSFAQNLFTPREQKGGRLKYGATFIFDKKYRPELERYVAETIVAEWGPKGLERAKMNLIKSPFLAGDGKEARDSDTGDLKPGMGPDVFFIRATANALDNAGNKLSPPSVWWKDPKVKETLEAVYSGCYGKAILNCFAWHNDESGDGVSFGVIGFQKLGEGERLGGGARSADTEKYHETIADDGPAPTETQGGKGAAGLFGE